MRAVPDAAAGRGGAAGGRGGAAAGRGGAAAWQSTAAAFRAAVESGRLDLPLPGSGGTRERWAGFAELAGEDLSVARLAEGHADAVAIPAELDSQSPPPGSTRPCRRGPSNRPPLKGTITRVPRPTSPTCCGGNSRSRETS